MAVPRNRTSNRRKNNKRSHHAKTPKSINTCSNCGGMRLAHRVCKACGHYGSRQVINLAGKQA